MDAAAMVVLREIKTELLEMRQMMMAQQAVGYNPDEAMTTEEAAKFCKVSKGCIRRWQKLGLPYVKAGKGFKFLQRDLVQWREQFMDVKKFGLRKAV